MTVIFGVGILVLTCLLWHFSGSWEWQMPDCWEERLSMWREARQSASRVLSLVWHLEDELDLERRYRQMRRNLPALERMSGTRLWIEVSLYIKGRRDKVERIVQVFEDGHFEVRVPAKL